MIAFISYYWNELYYNIVYIPSYENKTQLSYWKIWNQIFETPISYITYLLYSKWNLEYKKVKRELKEKVVGRHLQRTLKTKSCVENNSRPFLKAWWRYNGAKYLRYFFPVYCMDGAMCMYNNSSTHLDHTCTTLYKGK